MSGQKITTEIEAAAKRVREEAMLFMTGLANGVAVELRAIQARLDRLERLERAREEGQHGHPRH